MLKAHGHEIINKIQIVRTPISNILYQAINTITLGQLNERLQNSTYTDLFHLKIIINNKYSIEKEYTIQFTESNHISSNSEIRDVHNISSHLTIQQLCDNCYHRMKKQMFSYNSKNNNCQVFIRNLLDASGINGHEIFIMQDIKQIFQDFTTTRKIMNTVTDVGNRLSMLTEGTGLTRHKQTQKLTTLSNSDIYSICHKLKLKLNGIYMKDELIAPLAEGNYIINMQNHDEGGSHWVCFIKYQNYIYYHDSFGIIFPENLYDIFRLESDHIYYNTSDHQNIDSTSCGWFCIMFLYFMKVSKKGTYIEKFRLFNKLFTKDTLKNETVLKNYFDKIYFKKK
jgi:hypothetical protein